MHRCLLAFLGLLAAATTSAWADDWPQWMGPRRDGVWRESGLLDAFPSAGLPIHWRAPLGAGYSGPAVAGGHVYVTDHSLKLDSQRPRNPFQRISQPGSERVVCLDEATGKLLWEHPYDADYTMSYSAGPRATPAVDSDRVYTLGAEGDLLCLKCADGQLIWSKKFSNETTPTPTWGFSAHPLVDGKKLICITAGHDPAAGHGLVTAFDKLSGAVLWSALSAKEPGYAPPMIYTAGGTRQLIIWSPEALSGLDPETGKIYWSQPFACRQGLSVLTPRFIHDPALGDLLFVSTQYEGSLVMRLDPAEPKASLFWKRGGKSDRKTDALHSLLSPPLLRDGRIYGVCIQGELRCLDLKTGDREWSTFDATTYDAGQQKWSSAFLIPLGETGDRTLIANEHGDLILAQLNPAGYHQISRTHLLDPTNTDPGRPVLWCFPALADRCIFWRNDKEIICAAMAAP